jgi:hypothetical protein
MKYKSTDLSLIFSPPTHQNIQSFNSFKHFNTLSPLHQPINQPNKSKWASLRTLVAPSVARSPNFLVAPSSAALLRTLVAPSAARSLNFPAAPSSAVFPRAWVALSSKKNQEDDFSALNRLDNYRVETI